MKLKDIGKFVYSILFMSAYVSLHSQITKIPTGSEAALYDLSVIRNNVLLGGCLDYLGKSNDGCNTLIALAIPGPSGNVTQMQRLDSNTVFLLSYDPSQTLLFKSTDGGQSWTQRPNTSGAFSHVVAFFDTTEALMTDGPFLWRTTNGGYTWTGVPSTPLSAGKTCLKVFGDSTVGMGGMNTTGRGLVLSKDRGNTWGNGWGTFGHDIEISDFFFQSRDTIFACSTGGIFVSTMNGGNNWTSIKLPLKDANAIRFRDANLGYVVGVNDQGNGVILKTTDLGKNWYTFDTGIQTTLLNISFLNDSIVLLTGTNGVLLKWRYKDALFTGLTERQLSGETFKLFPNPVRQKLYVTSGNPGRPLTLSILDNLGQLVLSKANFDESTELDVSALSPGIYFVTVQDTSKRETFRICKE